MHILPESLVNSRWERIALTRAIYELWRWGWYQNAQKSIPLLGVRGVGSRVRGQGSKQGSNIKIWGYFELFSRLHQLMSPVLTPDPWPLTPDSWPLTGKCSSEHFGTNPIFITQKVSFWEHLSMKLLEMQILPVYNKMLRRAFRSQGSGVRGQWSGVRGQGSRVRGQILRFFFFF